MFEFVDMKVQPPSEVDVGGTSVNVRCVIGKDCAAKAPRIGVPCVTRICVARDLAEKFPVAACEAVMVDVPAPTTAMDLPEIIATLELDEVKTHGAGEFVVGGTMGIEPTPYVVVIIGNGPRIVNVACAGVADATSEIIIAKIA